LYSLALDEFVFSENASLFFAGEKAVHALAVSLAGHPMPFIFITVWPNLCTLAFFIAVYELALIFTAIRLLADSMAVLLTTFPFAFV